VKILVLVLSFIVCLQILEASPIGGCAIFPADNIWNQAVDKLPVDTKSSFYIQTIGADRGIHPDWGGTWEGSPLGIPITIVTGSQPKVVVDFVAYGDQSDPGPYPIPPNARIEGGDQGTGDRHVLVIENTTCTLYETFNSYRVNNGASWKVDSGAIFKLKDPTEALRPAGWTSADAAGLPILPGLVRYDEVQSGKIDHALRFTVPGTRDEYLWPARHEASTKDGIQYPPMGQRFRLKSSFDISKFSRDTQVILQAFKTYGLILADNGSPWYVQGTYDERWNLDTLVPELRNVTGTNFEALDESSLMIDPNRGTAKQQP